MAATELVQRLGASPEQILGWRWPSREPSSQSLRWESDT
jgi:hypothetical protein